jgi:hypothetical protein
MAHILLSGTFLEVSSERGSSTGTFDFLAGGLDCQGE